MEYKVKDMLEDLDNKIVLAKYRKFGTYQLDDLLNALGNVPLPDISQKVLLWVLKLKPSAVSRSTQEGVWLESPKGEKLLPNLVLLDQYGKLVSNPEQAECIASGTTSLDGYIHTPVYYPLQDLYAFVLMQNMYPSSKFMTISGAQKDNADYSSACPLVLRAFKRQQGIGYQVWNKSGDMSEVLPYMLKNIQAVAAFGGGFFRARELRGYIETLFHAAKKKPYPGPEAYTVGNYMAAVNDALESGRRERGPLPDREKAFENLHKNFQRIVAQVWVYNAKYRTDNLILDFTDWDVVPEDVWEGFIGFKSPKAFNPTGNTEVFANVEPEPKKEDSIPEGLWEAWGVNE